MRNRSTLYKLAGGLSGVIHPVRTDMFFRARIGFILGALILMATACQPDTPTNPVKDIDDPTESPTVASVIVLADQKRVIGVGVDLQLTAVATSDDDSVLTEIVFDWTSNDSTIAVVDDYGLVTTTGIGRVVIYAEAEGVIGLTAIEALPVGVRSLSLASTHNMLPSGGMTQPLTFTAFDALGEPILNPVVTWTSNNEESATVDEHGIVTTGIHGIASISVWSGDIVSRLTLKVFATTGDGTLDLDLQLLPLLNQLISLGDNLAPTGMSVALVKGGKLVMVRGYGLADPETSTPVEPLSLFRIASISKPITATTILRLVENGQLSLDDKLLDKVPFLAPDSGIADDRAADISIRNLLEHKGGWDRSIGVVPGFILRTIAEDMGVPSPPSPQAYGQWVFARPLHFAPGTRYTYNNFNYFLLGQVIEAVTGLPYETYIQQDVLQPLGITEMRTGGTLLSDRVTNEVAYNHGGQNRSIFDGIAGQLPNQYGGRFHNALNMASGGWIASAVDLARFGVASNNPPILLGEPMHDYMTTDQSGIGVYGAGWILNLPDYNHSGGLEGTNSFLTILDDGRIIVLLFNGNISTGFAPFTSAILAVNQWPEHDLFDRY